MRDKIERNDHIYGGDDWTMSKAIMILAQDFEETEAITVADILRRAGVDLRLAALSELHVTGAHGVTIVADSLFADEGDGYDAVILPGGPGARHYLQSSKLMEAIKRYFNAGKTVAAICAAPAALAAAGIMDGKSAVCYPGFEADMKGAKLTDAPVVADGGVITAKGPGAAVHFGLKLIEALEGEAAAKEISEKFIAFI